MNASQFLLALQSMSAQLSNSLAGSEGEWIVKGFIDIYQRIYTISFDTKIISKVFELLLMPAFQEFATRNDLLIELAPHQNFYPDLTFISQKTGQRFAVDVKSTYRQSPDRVNGMTLGAFTGYFRNRESAKNTLYPYNSYAAHYVLGIVYSRSPEDIDENRQYSLSELPDIPSVVRDFAFFAHPKYAIAGDKPGSGNTKNIGSVTQLESILNGLGPFASLGEVIYDDYWMYYLTHDMARSLEVERPYYNLHTYREYKTLGLEILNAHQEEFASMSSSDDTSPNDEMEV